MIICTVPWGPEQLENKLGRGLVIKRSGAMEPQGSLPGCGHIAGLTCTARWVIAGG
jgi:hypothetical protein